MWQDFVSVIWEPIEFARRRTEPNHPWLAAISTVVAASLLHIVLFLSLQSQLTGPITTYLNGLQGGEDFLRSFGTFSAITSFLSIAGGLSMIPLWVAGAGFACWSAVLLDGRENFKKVLQLFGYAHLPLLIYCVVAILILFIWPQSVEIRGTGSKEISDVVVAVQSLRDEYLMSTPIHTIRVLGYAAQLWSLGLLAVASSVVQRISYVKGIVAVSCYGGLIFVLGRVFS